MSDPLYRVRQLIEVKGALPLSQSEIRRLQEFLPPAALELFRTMPAGDQRHSWNVFSALWAQGHREPPLLQAALLHDAAKGRIGLGHRTVVILLNALSKAALPRLASANPHSWRYPLYLSVQHPEIGAQWAERAGVDPAAVVLIRRHQVPPPAQPGDPLDVWQSALKTIDDQM